MEPAILIFSIVIILLNAMLLYHMHKLTQQPQNERLETVLQERLSAMEHAMEIRQDMTLETISMQMTLI